MRVLLVDDHKIIRNVLGAFLKEALVGSTIVEANNGQEGLNTFKEESFDLVIADINMPVMDGIEMVKQMKSIQKDLKVIALSMMDDSVCIKKMLKAGASG